MNELDLAVLHRAATHGMHSFKLSLDANDVLYIQVIAPTEKTTMSSVIEINKDAAACSFSFSEKELTHGGKLELTSHKINCATVTDVVQIIDKFRTHIMAAYVDPERIKRHLHKYADKVDDFVPKVEGSLDSVSDLDPHDKLANAAPTMKQRTIEDAAAELSNHKSTVARSVAVKTFISEVGDGAQAYKWPTKKEEDLPFNTDLDDEDKP